MKLVFSNAEDESNVELGKLSASDWVDAHQKVVLLGLNQELPGVSRVRILDEDTGNHSFCEISSDKRTLLFKDKMPDPVIEDSSKKSKKSKKKESQ